MQRMTWTKDEYHAAAAISSGFIRIYSTEGPLVAYHQYVARDMPVDEEKDWQRLGTAFHLAMEGKPVDDGYVIMPPVVPDWFAPEMAKESELKARGGTKKHGLHQLDGEGSAFNGLWDRHKLFRDEHRDAAYHQGKSWLTVDEAETVKQQVEAVFANRAAAELLGPATSGNQEVSITAVCDSSGLKLKALADVLLPGTVIDFKTTRHRTIEDFSRDCFGKGYHWQLAHYCRVCQCTRAVVITVTKEFPFESMVYEFDEACLREADEQNRNVLAQIKHSYDSGSWHTLGHGLVNMIGGDV